MVQDIGGARTPTWQFGGAIAVGGAAQLILPAGFLRTFVTLQNTSSGALTVGVGPARAVAAVANGAVSSVTVTNAGMGYTKPPLVRFLGGLGGGLGFPKPPGPGASLASAHAVLSGATIGSVVVDNGGVGYTAAPFVFLYNHPEDFTGSMAPAVAAGNTLAAGGSMTWEVATTDAISIWGATLAQTFECSVRTS